MLFAVLKVSGCYGYKCGVFIPSHFSRPVIIKGICYMVFPEIGFVFPALLQGAHLHRSTEQMSVNSV